MYNVNETMFLSNLMFSRECAISGSWYEMRYAPSVMVFSKVTKRENLGLVTLDHQETEGSKLGETKVPRVHRSIY